NDIFNREDFYKVLLGILEPRETVLLSTHLIEEVSGFVDRAVLIHKGQIIGDRLVSSMEEEGTDLMTYIKTSYGYKPDRVGKAVESMTEGGADQR
ncbi:MAG: ABC transporter ATP-binding protein, partial [Firmicutes bacterium]|nr:ABC transporter ATP-binding protein [Bacillota bacterium]